MERPPFVFHAASASPINDGASLLGVLCAGKILLSSVLRHTERAVGTIGLLSGAHLYASVSSVGIDLLVLGKLDRYETLGVENPRELLDGSRFAVDSICLLIFPNKEVDETRWMLGFLPHFVAQ